jgi:hypothetical protein
LFARSREGQFLRKSERQRPFKGAICNFIKKNIFLQLFCKQSFEKLYRRYIFFWVQYRRYINYSTFTIIIKIYEIEGMRIAEFLEKNIKDLFKMLT